MSGGFRDTFTKEEQEGLLGYDDTAFYYFAGSVLLVIAVPWTFSVVNGILFPGKAQVEKEFPKKSTTGSTFRYCGTSAMEAKISEARRQARTFTAGGSACWIIKIVTLSLIWLSLYAMSTQFGTEKRLQKFDPFEILEVSAGADAKDIKKAYRKLSLVWHPDKNPDDPLAQSRFIQITKAYNALTDEGARRNFEKYGNPDGPQGTKIGIGLPIFLIQKENHLLILCAFFFLLLFIVPMTFICYYQRTKNYAANGVMIETLQFMGYYIGEATRCKNCPEMFAASQESRLMPIRPTDNAHMKPLMENVVEHKKREFKDPRIIRNQFLIWGHMQRLHENMSPELREDLDTLLRHSMRITQAMIEIACMREWFFTAQNMIEFRRSLVQAMDLKSPQLLQVPHFTEEALKYWQKKSSAANLSDFLSRDAEQRRHTLEKSFNPQQIADIEAFCQHVTDMEVNAKIEVEDEKEIVEGDVCAVTVTLTRKGLKEKEAIGPVHAPLFPEPKFEEWWLFLVEATTSPRIVAWERVRDTERQIEEKLRFQVSRPGKQSMVLHVLCDSYIGLDHKIDLTYTVMREDEAKRQIFVHPEDEDLDMQPTLFQQFMGDFNREEESEEEEEEEDKSKKKVKAPAQNLSEEKKAKAAVEEDDKDEAAAKKDSADGDESSDTSSDSD
mmetsp:Transcript_64016/g.152660  ORF Transcript_64016/g.152660 Transcript_64016/m.152660 type:complete len:668 (-) Transcript_64016:69-2072(-)|eukprot:CAMPEP_0178425844 /NCGR_PEP_ID=MMETSP0689_2-20121128/28929_1 /TAXON_ID=160604 /ORGANISM="Amphidinium massartii, Strain CS-259" /LENGTH=667 /DNA_ID=CAMNT_0020047513 /DNA_START=80 /DNA_END=2083 /DNA_ORIENTATION=-